MAYMAVLIFRARTTLEKGKFNIAFSLCTFFSHFFTFFHLVRAHMESKTIKLLEQRIIYRIYMA